jgi:ArsR family transcriptional regulator, lead/cadmium/zinc/bismuth-responsive transcriptional repressor
MPSKNPLTTPCCSPTTDARCPPRLALRDRPLLTPEQAGDLAGLFKLVGNDTRVRLLHALTRTGEMCVTELAEAVGMKSQAVSNQLQRLSDLGIVTSRRDGSHIRYRIIDPCVMSLLDQGLCLLEAAVERQAWLRSRRTLSAAL